MGIHPLPPEPEKIDNYLFLLLILASLKEFCKCREEFEKVSVECGMIILDKFGKAEIVLNNSGKLLTSKIS